MGRPATWQDVHVASPEAARGALQRGDALVASVAPRALALLLFVLSALVYASNGKTIDTGDSVPARLIPIAIVLDGTPMLDRFASAIDATWRDPYFVRRTPYGLASFYPIATGLIATPIIAPAVLWIGHGEAPDAMGWLAIGRRLEKLAATLIVALAVVVFHASCRALRIAPLLALILTLTFAFGSQAFSTSSQALWQHGPGTLALLAALWCLARAATHAQTALLLGFSSSAALAVAIRPSNLLLVAPLVLVALRQHPRRLPVLLVPLVLGAALLLAYNQALFGNLGGGYVSGNFPLGRDLAAALLGVLLSPGRGLLVYFPIAVLLLVLLLREPGAFASALPVACLAAVAATILLVAAWPSWWGGYCYGPRLLSEVQPLILLLIGLGIGGALPRRRALYVGVVTALLPLQVLVQAIGSYGPPGEPPAAVVWNAAPVSIDAHPERHWDLRDSPIARGARALLGIRE